MVVMQSSMRLPAEPYPFVGATARCDAEILIKTIDMMVKRANNVPKEEALMIWGPEKSYDSLKSHSLPT
jgi:hypothetical protein